MTEYESDDSESSESVACPWDGCDRVFGGLNGMKVHHVKTHGESIAGYEVSCHKCGKDFRVHASSYHAHDRYFCSQECNSTWRSEHYRGENHPRWNGGRSEAACDYCGETFMVYLNARTGENTFCSRKCLGEWQSENQVGENNPNYNHVEVNCAWCGEPKKTKPCRLTQDNHFCDNDCHAKWRSKYRSGENAPDWLGGKPYGEGWTEEKREGVRERQNRQCAACGISEAESGRKLDVHHIFPARTVDDPEVRNSDSNLVAYCADCHRRWEGIPLRPMGHTIGIENGNS